MLDMEQYVEVKWHPKNKEYYTHLGYKFTKYKDSFMVKVKDLSHASKSTVNVICDYCGTVVPRRYADYIKYHTEQGDSCKYCHGTKAKMFMRDTYGVDNVSQLESVKDKRTKTFNSKYGVDNPFQSKECMDKARKTLMDNYGVERPMQSEEIKERHHKAFMNKYGVDNPSQLDWVKEKKRDTCMNNFGVEHPMQSEIVKQKAVDTLLDGGNVPTSKPERETCSILADIYGQDNCTPSYRLGNYVLDCRVHINGILIDCEFDGSYWHNNAHKDSKRDEYVMSQNYKVLRINGRYKCPSKKELIEAINSLLESDGNYIKIYTDI